MNVDLVDPRVDAEPADWAAFAATQGLHPVWDFDLMRVESWLARNPAVLAVVRDGDRIAAAASVLVCRLPPSASFARPRGWRMLRPGWADVYLPWLSGFPGIAFADRTAVPDRVAARRALERELARRLGPGLLGVVYRAARPDDLPVLTGRGRVVRDWPATTAMTNEWSTVDEWLGSLSRSRRKSMVRQQRALAAERGLVVSGGPGRTDLDSTEVARLINAHRLRLGQLPRDVRTPVTAAYLDRFLALPQVHTLTYHDDDGTLLAVNTMLDNPRCVVKQHWATRAGDDGGRRHLYFDTYIRAIRYLTGAGRPEVSAGNGLPELKQSLGFQLRRRSVVLAPRPVLGR